MNIKKYILLAICIGVFQILKAQSFTSSPNDTAEAFIAPNEFFGMYIYQRNLAGTDIQLAWTKISESIPVGWDYSLCDFGTCYAGFPSSGSMAMVTATDSGFVSPHCNPFNIPGTLTVRFYVYDVASPTTGDTLTFIYTAQSAGVESLTSTDFIIYPNPTSNFIQLKATNMELPAHVIIYDMNGKAILNQNLVNEGDIIDVTLLTPGNYILEIRNQTVVRKAFLKK